LHDPLSSQSVDVDEQGPSPARRTARQRKSRPPLFKFPLHYPKALPDGPPPPPYLSYNLDAAYHIDGSSITDVLASEDPSRSARNDRSKRGASAFVKYMPNRVNVYATKVEDASNNAAEFVSLEEALKDAVKCQHRTILIVTDSQLTFDLIIDADYRIARPHLKAIADRIKALLKSVPIIYASKVFSHRSDTCVGNQAADALCTWAISSLKATPLIMTLSNHPIHTRMLAINRLDPQCPQPENPSRECCAICLKKNDHNHSTCPLRTLPRPSSNSPLCLACLAADHSSDQCPLYRDTRSRPSLAKDTLPLQSSPNPNLVDIVDIDFLNFNFPPKPPSREQFLDYYETIFSTLLFRKDLQHVKAAQDALIAWGQNYRMEGASIRRNRRHAPLLGGDNRNPNVVDPDDLLAKRALKAASLGMDARVSDVSKALRSTPPIPLTDEVKHSLKALYPPAKAEEIFEPKPLKNFQISRHAVARAIRSRSRMSHPGTLGLNYAILQNYMNWTYGKESHDSPDPRWTVFCELIALIMSGNAIHLSPMLHEIFGFFFDKNFDKQGEPLSIRNIGVEETLLRIPAALVFEKVIQDAIDRNFLTQFDLGAGVTGIKAGAEIFSRIAEMASLGGCIITAMDVKKAFNNLRRKDIKAAVADFNNPLLTAFVHFLFERDPVVTFKDRLSQDSVVFTLTEGILQGNPLSVFIFALTLAYILRPLRLKHQKHSIIPAFVDDMLFISNPSQTQVYPQMLDDFFQTFSEHGLEFDLNISAKTSVYSRKPLPQNTQKALAKINVRCQNEGLAPCKCPFGTDSFMSNFMTKQTTKLQGRYEAFDALWNALLKFDAGRKKPTRRTHEHYLNLVRLSFLSMPMYTLRAVNPLFREHYTEAATSWANSLISRVFPPKCLLPPSHQVPSPPCPIISAAEMEIISERIMQLPLSTGGLSLRLPSSVSNIAYLSSCIDCEELMRRAAHALNISFKLENFPGFATVEAEIIRNTSTITALSVREARASVGVTSSTTQQFLTSALNEHEITTISMKLKRCPIYHYAFQARTDPRQDHTSWPLNPKARAAYSIGALDDANFSRAIQIATLRPIFDFPRQCEHCKNQLDSVGLHLLNCQNTHYTLMHETVKRSLAQCLRGLFNSHLAPLSVHVEAPVNRFAPLRQPNLAEGSVLKADIVLILSGTSQQDVFITDVVSALAHTPNHRGDGFYYDLTAKELIKRSKYYKYLIPPGRFFPLAFGRTNVLSKDTLRFCEVVGSYFPKLLKFEAKIRASLSRGITSGVAASFNDEIRRLQLGSLNAVAGSMVPPAPDTRANACVAVGSSKIATARALPSLSALTALHTRLSAIASGDGKQRLSAEADGPSSLYSGGLLQRLVGDDGLGLGS
jgi:ribonuclease HI